MAIVTTNLGVITAYGDAVAAGYTGTKAQWQELMASYATVAQNAAASATAAASSATSASSSASTATTAKNAAVSANTAAQSAKETAVSANTSAQSAKDAAVAANTAIQNMSAQATTLAEGASATVTKTVDSQTGAITLEFGIPQGATGPTGPQGPQGEYAAVDTALSTTSTNPVQNKVVTEGISNLNNQINAMHLYDRDDSDAEYTITKEVIDGHLVTTYTAVTA